MKKRYWLASFLSLLLSLWSSSSLLAQVVAPGRGGAHVVAGGFFSDFSPDYGSNRLYGIGGFLDLNLRNHIGVEGEIHYSVLTPTDLSENTYLIGPRYTVRRKRFSGYAKALFGMGRFGTQGGSFGTTATSAYTAYAFGGGVEYMATRNINVRVFDVELQKWPSFPPNGLSPISYSIGVAYVIH